MTLKKDSLRFLDLIEDFDIDNPFASKFTATLIGNIISLENSLPFSFLENSVRHLVHAGKAANIVAFVLKVLTDLKGEEWVMETVKNSKVDMMQFFKRDDRNAEFLKKFLEQKDLQFLESVCINSKGQEGGKSLLNTPISPSSSSSSLQRLQHRGGYWTLTEEFINLILPQYSLTQVKEAIPSSIRTAYSETNDSVGAEKLWSTILAIQYLDDSNNNSTENELFTKKSLSYVKLEVEELDLNLEELNQKAKEYLTKKKEEEES